LVPAAGSFAVLFGTRFILSRDVTPFLMIFASIYAMLTIHVKPRRESLERL